MLTKLYVAGQNRLASDEGATAVEYGIMVALIAAAIVLTVLALGERLDTIFNDVLTAISPAAG